MALIFLACLSLFFAELVFFAPQLIHKHLWRQFAFYRDSPLVLKNTYEWHIEHEEAPEFRESLVALQRRIFWFLIACGIFWTIVWASISRQDNLSQVAYFFSIIICLNMFFAYLYWLTTARSPKTGKRVFRNPASRKVNEHFLIWLIRASGTVLLSWLFIVLIVLLIGVIHTSLLGVIQWLS